MEPRQAEAYLHRHIPLSRALEVHVVRLDLDGATLEAPLRPNLNHRGTAFGGSLSALGILAGWVLVHSSLLRAGWNPRLVIQRHEVDFTAPAEATFEAWAPAPHPDAWSSFLHTYRRRNRARIDVSCELRSEGRRIGASTGRYVAVAADS